MPIIDKVTPLSDYKLLVELINGQALVLNFESKLNSLRFNIIENKDIFKRVSTDGFSVLWNKGKLRVSLGEMIEMLQDIKTLFKVV
ncbi:MAG: hypothetical protein K2M73_08780 [Lachnospiraceae bacterium]|nr:hypothetical protein [Lachnospiraceae bacterium]